MDFGFGRFGGLSTLATLLQLGGWVIEDGMIDIAVSDTLYFASV